MARDGQIVHEEPHEDERQRGRDCPEIADALHIDLFSCSIDERRTEESAKAHAEQERRGEVDDRDAEVADAGVDAERKSLLRFREEETDICHRRGEVRARNADHGDEHDEFVIGRRGVGDGVAESDEWDQQERGGKERPVAAADDGGHIGVDEPSRRADETWKSCECKDFVISKVESDLIELCGNRCPHRPCNEGEGQRPRRCVEVALGNALAVTLPKIRILRIPMRQNFAARGIRLCAQFTTLLYDFAGKRGCTPPYS